MSVNMLLYWMYVIRLNAPQRCAWQKKKKEKKKEDSVWARRAGIRKAVTSPLYRSQSDKNRASFKPTSHDETLDGDITSQFLVSRSNWSYITSSYDPNSKHWFTTSFLWRNVPESGARSVHVTVIKSGSQQLRDLNFCVRGAQPLGYQDLEIWWSHFWSVDRVLLCRWKQAAELNNFVQTIIWQADWVGLSVWTMTLSWFCLKFEYWRRASPRGIVYS